MDIENEKFRISAYTAETIKMMQLPAASAKLLFALIYLQEKTVEAWPTMNLETTKPQNHFVFVNQLRKLGFPAKTGSSRFLRKPVLELTSLGWLFDHLEISENGRFLSWRVSNAFVRMMSAMDVYALLDASEIAMVERKYDGELLAQISLHRKKRIPEFKLIGPNNGFEYNVDNPSDILPRKLNPSQLKRQLSPALQKWADATGTSFAVLLVQEGSQPGYTDVVIRMKHRSTKWPPGRFLRRDATSLLWTLVPEQLSCP